MDITSLIQEIVTKANDMKDKHTSAKNSPVNYACIFAQDKEQYDKLLTLSKKIGSIIKETPTGPLFNIHPLTTVAGNLKLLKIRKPDKTRPELGDADFTVDNYLEFKKKYLPKNEFRLIQRENFEMIELIDPNFDVRAYFSSVPLNKQLSL